MVPYRFGDVGIDDALLAKNTKMQADEEIIEMMNGCICCTVRQDLIVVLNKLAKRIKAGKLKLDGIVIETTGMADPAPVAQTFFVDEMVKESFKLDGIVTLVDAKHIEQHLGTHQFRTSRARRTAAPADRARLPPPPDDEKPEGAENEAVEQVAFADRILLNKTDLVTEEDLVRIEARLKSMNSAALIKRCSQANVSPDWVLDIGAFDLKRTLEMDPGEPSHAVTCCHMPSHAGNGPGGAPAPAAISARHLCAMVYRHFSLARGAHRAEFLNTDGEHEHDTSVSSVSITQDGLVDMAAMEEWIGVILRVKGADMYRMKGVLNVRYGKR